MQEQEQEQKQELKRSFAIGFLSMLLVIIGVVILSFPILEAALLYGVAGVESISRSDSIAFEPRGFFFLIGMGCFSILLGLGCWKGELWAWVLGMASNLILQVRSWLLLLHSGEFVHINYLSTSYSYFDIWILVIGIIWSMAVLLFLLEQDLQSYFKVAEASSVKVAASLVITSVVLALALLFMLHWSYVP